MTKRRVICLLAASMLLGMTACGKTNADQENTAKETVQQTTQQESEIQKEPEIQEETEVQETADIQQESGTTLTPEDAEQLLVSVLGTQDEQTGYTYSFGYIETMTIDGAEYHAFVWSWLVEDHNSRLGELFVAVDGSAIYEGEYLGDSAEVNTQKNLLTQ